MNTVNHNVWEGLSLGSDSRVEQMFATGLGKPKATLAGAIVGRSTQRPMKLQYVQKADVMLLTQTF